MAVSSENSFSNLPPLAPLCTMEELKIDLQSKHNDALSKHIFRLFQTGIKNLNVKSLKSVENICFSI